MGFEEKFRAAAAAVATNSRGTPRHIRKPLPLQQQRHQQDVQQPLQQMPIKTMRLVRMPLIHVQHRNGLPGGTAQNFATAALAYFPSNTCLLVSNEYSLRKRINSTTCLCRGETSSSRSSSDKRSKCIGGSSRSFISSRNVVLTKNGIFSRTLFPPSSAALTAARCTYSAAFSTALQHSSSSKQPLFWKRVQKSTSALSNPAFFSIATATGPQGCLDVKESPLPPSATVKGEIEEGKLRNSSEEGFPAEEQPSSRSVDTPQKSAVESTADADRKQAKSKNEESAAPLLLQWKNGQPIESNRDLAAPSADSAAETQQASSNELFSKDPDEMVAALDKYIIGQNSAKKSLAIALRDRWRRQQVFDEELRREITPNNLLLIGPSGCGKTELARRLAAFAGAPFVKVAATRFTEVGFVGEDTSSIIHYLAQQALADEKEKEQKIVYAEAKERALREVAEAVHAQGDVKDSLELLIAMLREGRLDDLEVEISEHLLSHRGSEGNPQDPFSSLLASFNRALNVKRSSPRSSGSKGVLLPQQQMFPAAAIQLKKGGPISKRWPNTAASAANRGAGMAFALPLPNLLGGAVDEELPKKRTTVKKALSAVIDHFVNEMSDTEAVQERARMAAEDRGIVFLDEFDKLVEDKVTGDTSSAFRSKRVGVQRELLTLIEGTSVHTQIGVINTDHILFIASGAFLSCKPSDIIPELQGRLPVRCDLKPLTEDDFVRILTETQYNLLMQQQALLATEGVKLIFEDGAVREIARIAFHLNSVNANVGARRLRTVLAKVLEDTKFEAQRLKGKEVRVSKHVVEERLRPLMLQTDLCKYIL